MEETLELWLGFYHNDTVREIALTLGLIDGKLAMGRKQVLVQECARRILQNVQSKAYLAALSPAERALLAVLLRENRSLAVSELVLPMLLSGLVFIDGHPACSALPHLSDVLLSLLRKGIVVNATELLGSATRRTLTDVRQLAIAREVADVLRREAFSYPPNQLDMLSGSEPVQIKRGDFESMMRQLFFLWADIRQQPVLRLKSGGIGKRELRRLAANLGVAADEIDLDHVQQLCTVLLALKLLQEEPDALTAAESHAVTLFWDARPLSHLRQVLALYMSLETTLPADARKLPSAYTYSAVLIRPYSTMRARVVETLKAITSAGWVPFALVAGVFDSDVGSLIIDERTRQFLFSDLRWRGEQRIRDLEAGLLQMEREVLLAILEELFSFGMLDLGYAGQLGGAPVSLRFSPPALAALQDQPLPQTSGEGQVIAQPDFQILAMGPVSLGILVELERVALREKLTTRVVSYRLVREQAYRAFQKGASQHSIASFLEEITGQPLPQNVARSLEEWYQQYERIVLHRAVSIVQTDSDEAMTALLEDPKIGRFLNRMDNRTAWLLAQHLTELEQHLWALQQLPAYSVGPQADLPASMNWDGESLVARQALPSLFVSGTLRRIAVQEGQGWSLTPQSIRGAVSAGMQVADIIHLLEQLTGEKVPAEWRRRLKAWGKHFGDAALAHVILLKFENAAALAELRREEPLLGRWLRPLSDADGMEVIDEKHVEEALKLFTDLGVQVVEGKWW